MSTECLNAEHEAKLAELERTAAALKESEARLIAANLDLERRASEQTAELKAANARLTEAVEQRDVLLRDVYHRVKNNLQIVDALLAAQLRQTSDQETLAALRDVRQRIYAMGLVHKQLMQSKDLKTFDVAPYLRELSANIIQSSACRGVSLSVQAAPLAVGLDFAIPLGLLVTELLTNSLKHAFPDGVGDVSVVLERGEDDKVGLIVADNGRVPESLKSVPFSSKPGQGVNIITGLVNQLKGTLAIQTDNGTRTEIYATAPPVRKDC